jgi:hypothetical protein
MRAVRVTLGDRDIGELCDVYGGCKRKRLASDQRHTGL